MKYVNWMILCMFFFMGSCNKCDGDDPTARIINNGTGNVNITLTDSDGKVNYIAEFTKETVSDYQSYASGKVKVHYIITGEIDTTSTIALHSCKRYDITINNENELILFSKEVK